MIDFALERTLTCAHVVDLVPDVPRDAGAQVEALVAVRLVDAHLVRRARIHIALEYVCRKVNSPT